MRGSSLESRISRSSISSAFRPKEGLECWSVSSVVKAQLSEDLIVAFDTSKFRQEYANYVKALRALRASAKLSFRGLGYPPQQHFHAGSGI